MACQNYAGTTEDFKQALELNPAYAEGHACLGDCWLQLNNRQSALENYQKALELCPENQEVFYKLNNLQQQIVDELPPNTPAMKVRLKNGNSALIVSNEKGEIFTLWQLALEFPIQTQEEKISSQVPSVTPEETGEFNSLPVKNPSQVPSVTPEEASAKGKQLIQECLLGHEDKVRELIAAGADLQTELFGRNASAESH